jgi:hypothetical protein
VRHVATRCNAVKARSPALIGRVAWQQTIAANDRDNGAQTLVMSGADYQNKGY